MPGTGACARTRRPEQTRSSTWTPGAPFFPRGSTAPSVLNWLWPPVSAVGRSCALALGSAQPREPGGSGLGGSKARGPQGSACLVTGTSRAAWRRQGQRLEEGPALPTLRDLQSWCIWVPGGTVALTPGSNVSRVRWPCGLQTEAGVGGAEHPEATPWQKLAGRLSWTPRRQAAPLPGLRREPLSSGSWVGGRWPSGVLPSWLATS